MAHGNDLDHSGSNRAKRTAVVVLTAATLAAAGGYFWLSKRAKTAPPAAAVAVAGGRYEDLSAGQRRLIDDWTARFNAAMGKKVSPLELYEDLALSSKTTFHAVTHALSQTPLTNAGGQPLNMTALDLVQSLQSIAGSYPGKGGDKQFRLYVQAKPETRTTLEKVREFSRQPDNTIYHQGDPICFRGSGGTPSIQFSLSADGNHADIDVDYRSSSFPIMLVNGHLTASNSDVRAGDNDQRHNGHWSGLKNWWRGFMGVPLYESGRFAEAVVGDSIAKDPRLGKGTEPAEAIHDFLSAWLVEQKPGIALGYLSPHAYPCMELRNGGHTDAGVAVFRIFRAMQSVNKLAGKPAQVADAVRAVSYEGPRGEAVQHAFEKEFSLYELREDLAAQLDCETRLRPEQADLTSARSTRFGGYAGATFRLQSGTLRGDTVATVWAKEDGAWRLVSYESGSEAARGTGLAAPAPMEEKATPPAVVKGDAAMIRAVTAFFEDLIVRKDTRAAMARIGAGCLPCYNVYRSDAAPQAGTPADARKLLAERMQLLAEWAGEAKSVGEVLVAAEPHHGALKLVRHKQQAAFAIVSIPDSMGSAAECGQLKRGETPKLSAPGGSGYGRYYAASLRFRKAGAEGAVLWTLWKKEAGEWRISSYLVMTP